MTEINKIDLLKIDARLKSRNIKTSAVSGEKNKFEDQLLQTVKKLETMGNEIDAMMESSTIQQVSKGATAKESNTKLMKSIDSMVENISAAGKSSVKSAKNVALQYEQMNTKKRV